MSETAAPDNKGVATVAATASTAAVACAVCCVLPFALPAALLGTFGGVFAFFERAYPWMKIAAVLAVAAGWLWLLVQSMRTHRRPARSTLIIMTFATAAMTIALLWPTFEDSIISALR